MNLYTHMILIISAYAFLLSYNLTYSQEKHKIVTIAFYNVENLFDTINSVDLIDCSFGLPCIHKSIPYSKGFKLRKGKFDYEFIKTKAYRKTFDEQYTPLGKLKWNSIRYKAKLKNIAKVLYSIGAKTSQEPPIIVGLAEVENAQVLKDLISTYPMSEKPYDYVHYNSLDERGIDVALLYNKNAFRVTQHKKFTPHIYNKKKKRDYTRDLLLVEGMLDNEKIQLIITHWPSRKGGQRASEGLRKKIALLTKSIIDSLKKVNSNSKIILLGDLNDNPTNKSVKSILGASNNTEKMELFNTMFTFYKKGLGTLAWKDNWNLFDQIIICSLYMDKTSFLGIIINLVFSTPLFYNNRTENLKDTL